MIRKVATGAGFVVMIAASGALLFAAKAAPPRAPAAPAAQSAGDTFAATCKAETADIRPDPAWVRASFADDHCTAPGLPPKVDGYTASRAQVMGAITAMTHYNSAADRYQRCISDFVISRKALAEKDKNPLALTFVTIETHRIAASQNMKKQLAAQVDASINAFNEFGSECL